MEFPALIYLFFFVLISGVLVQNITFSVVDDCLLKSSVCRGLSLQKLFMLIPQQAIRRSQITNHPQFKSLYVVWQTDMIETYLVERDI